MQLCFGYTNVEKLYTLCSSVSHSEQKLWGTVHKNNERLLTYKQLFSLLNFDYYKKNGEYLTKKYAIYKTLYHIKTINIKYPKNS